jgi:hypothetical protein
MFPITQEAISKVMPVEKPLDRWIAPGATPFGAEIGVLFNCDRRLCGDQDLTIRRFADLPDVDRERVRLWTFARAAAEPRDRWEDDRLIALARAIAP